MTVVLCLIAVTLGSVQAWGTRHSMAGDGVSYLDIADAYFRGDWQAAVNAYWSPLYSWLLGAATHLIEPSPYWEFAVVHLVNFLIYLLALAGFLFLLSELTRFQRIRRAASSNGQFTLVPEWAFLVMSHMLFLWCSLQLISIGAPTPDMLVAAFIYFASGLIVRIRTGRANWFHFVLLGLVLGVNYLAKAAMFPLAFIFLAVSLFAARDFRTAWPRVLSAFFVFALVCAPLIATISITKGRWTFGDTGKLNYVWEFNVPRFVHWQGEPPGNGVPAHPTRKILDEPAVYEYATPIKGTYPPWLDPSYWYEGVAVRFDLVRQVISTLSLFRECFIVILIAPGIVFALFILLLSRRKLGEVGACLSTSWFLFAPALAGLLMYSMVFIDTRYIAPFVLLLGVGVFSSLELKKSKFSERFFVYTTLVCIATSAIILEHSLNGLVRVASREFVAMNEIQHNKHWRAAVELQKSGLNPGDKVAALGVFDNHWARVARAQYVSEIPLRFLRDRDRFLRDDYSPSAYATEETDKFWRAEPDTKSKVMQAFKAAGARAVVAERVPTWADTTGWHKIEDEDDDTKNDLYFYSLEG